jgi:hypothetical protein
MPKIANMRPMALTMSWAKSPMMWIDVNGTPSVTPEIIRRNPQHRDDFRADGVITQPDLHQIRRPAMTPIRIAPSARYIGLDILNSHRVTKALYLAGVVSVAAERHPGAGLVLSHVSRGIAFADCLLAIVVGNKGAKSQEDRPWHISSDICQSGCGGRMLYRLM